LHMAYQPHSLFIHKLRRWTLFSCVIVLLVAGIFHT